MLLIDAMINENAAENVPIARTAPTLELILDALSQHVLIVDGNGAITITNRAWRKFMRASNVHDDAWRQQPYVAACLAMVDLDADAKQSLESDLLGVLNGDLDRYSCEFATMVDGERQWFSLHGHALPQGGAVFTHHDISPTRALDRARARFNQLVDASTDAIMIVGVDGTISYANDTALRMAGALPGDDNHALTGLIDQTALAVAAATGAWHGEVRMRTRDAVEIPAMQDVRRQYPDGDINETPYFTIVVHDISAEKRREEELHNRHVELQLAYTHLKSAQEQLLQSEKMASIGQLAAGVAHEINNPIGYVHSNLGTLQDYTRSLFSLLNAYEDAFRSVDMSEEARRELDALRQRFELDYLVQDLPQLVAESREGIERVRKIVQDLKDFSHVGGGDDWEVVDLVRGLDSTLNIVWNEIKYKAELVKDYGPMPPVECLPSQINQVFLNILVNAAQAIEGRGTIRIATGATADEAWVAISDNGAGIPEAVQQRIFDPFFTTKPVGQGTGLGLSLSYSIISKHQGRIELTSKPGVGTTFKIVLPIRQKKIGQIKGEA